MQLIGGSIQISHNNSSGIVSGDKKMLPQYVQMADSHHNESADVSHPMNLLGDPNLDLMNHLTQQEQNYNSNFSQIPSKSVKSKIKGAAIVSQGSVTSEKSMGFNNHKNSLLEESISANSVVNMQQQLQKMNQVQGKRSGGSRTHAEGSRNRAS